MFLHRGFEGPRPRAVLVNDGGVSWPGEREREVVVSSLGALRECAVDLENRLDHRRVGEWRNAVERQDPGEHASSIVQPHNGQSPHVDVGFGQDLCPPDAQLCGRCDGRGRTWCRWHGRSVVRDGDSRSDFPQGTGMPVVLWKGERRQPPGVTSLDNEKSPPVGDGWAFASVSEGRHATYAHGCTWSRGPATEWIESRFTEGRCRQGQAWPFEVWVT
jgi:hypothetical protein